MKASEFVSKLKGVKRTPSGWIALCPAHPDKKPSLAITEGVDGRVLLHCLAGCSTEAILSKLNLKMADLFQTPSDQRAKRRIVATYDYTDERGRLLFQCVRFDPKDFRQRRPDPSRPGRWIWNLEGVRRVVYRLIEVVAALVKGRVIFVCEGEKDADILAAAGFVATCNPMGAGKWLPIHTQTLQGAARVVVIADKDQPGRAHAQAVATALHPVVRSVRLLELPDRAGTPVKDAADWFAAGGTGDELRQLVRATPEFAPSASAGPEAAEATNTTREEVTSDD